MFFLVTGLGQAEGQKRLRLLPPDNQLLKRRLPLCSFTCVVQGLGYSFAQKEFIACVYLWCTLPQAKHLEVGWDT